MEITYLMIRPFGFGGGDHVIVILFASDTAEILLFGIGPGTGEETDKDLSAQDFHMNRQKKQNSLKMSQSLTPFSSAECLRRAERPKTAAAHMRCERLYSHCVLSERLKITEDKRTNDTHKTMRTSSSLDKKETLLFGGKREGTKA